MLGKKMVIVKAIFYWLKYILIKFILEGLFFLFSLPLFPVAYFLKHKLNVHIIPFKWMMNYTKDGDFGDDRWRKERRITKYNLWVAWRWWWRNSNWTFKYLITPKQGEFELIKVVTGDETDLTWVTQTERETSHIYFTQAGQFNGRFSHTNRFFNLMMGSEHRYIFKLRQSK